MIDLASVTTDTLWVLAEAAAQEAAGFPYGDSPAMRLYLAVRDEIEGREADSVGSDGSVAPSPPGVPVAAPAQDIPLPL